MRCVILLFLICVTTPTGAGDWLTAPSFYTHNPVTGLRTNQHTSPPQAVVPQDPTFRGSGFHHYRSTIQYGQTADNYYRVEQWGPPVQPYGEWRFPNRPYSVPYDQWGAPFAGLNLGGYGNGPWGHPYGARYGRRPGGAYRGGGHHNGGHPGHEHDDDGHHGGGHDDWGSGPLVPGSPYPSGPHNPYPVPPYADGYHPSYPERPRLDDDDFFEAPTR